MNLITSERLNIRVFRQNDYDPLVVMMSDPEVMKFTGFKTPLTKERVQELLVKWIGEGAQELGVWAVEGKAGKEFVGWVMLKKTTTDTPELGYMLPQNQWGKGYASEIAVMMLDYARNTLRLSQVAAVTTPDNFPSIRVLEKADMKREGVRDDGALVFKIKF